MKVWNNKNHSNVAIINHKANIYKFYSKIIKIE